MKPSLLILMTALGTSALPGAVITSPSGHGEGAHGETIAKSADNSYYSKWYSKFSRSWNFRVPVSCNPSRSSMPTTSRRAIRNHGSWRQAKTGKNS